MSENSESAKLTIHVSSSNSTLMAFAKLDHCQQLKETANSQLWLWTISPNG
jgi:hypothetical protein